jgi:hypothetical protein
LIGPELKGMADFADDYAAVLQRPVAYAPQDLESWNAANIEAALASSEPHIAEHLKTLTRLVACGSYYDDLVSDDLTELLGSPPKTLRWALEHLRVCRTRFGRSGPSAECLRTAWREASQPIGDVESDGRPYRCRSVVGQRRLDSHDH